MSDNTKVSNHEDVLSKQVKFLQEIKEMTETIKAKSIYCVEKGIAYATGANNSIWTKIIRRLIECTH